MAKWLFLLSDVKRKGGSKCLVSDLTVFFLMHSNVYEIQKTNKLDISDNFPSVICRKLDQLLRV